MPQFGIELLRRVLKLRANALIRPCREHGTEPVNSILQLLARQASGRITLSVGIGSMLGEVLRPGENVMFAQLDPQKVPADTWSRFDEERLKLKVRICYCSVFEDCWIADSGNDRATPVKQCPADWHQFYGSAELGRMRN